MPEIKEIKIFSLYLKVINIQNIKKALTKCTFWPKQIKMLNRKMCEAWFSGPMVKYPLSLFKIGLILSFKLAAPLIGT